LPGVRLGLAILLFLARGIFGIGRRAPEAEVGMPAELEAPAALPELSPAAEQIASGRAAPRVAGESNELTERVRQLAKRDPALTVNVVRTWLQEGSTR